MILKVKDENGHFKEVILKGIRGEKGDKGDRGEDGTVLQQEEIDNIKTSLDNIILKDSTQLVNVMYPPKPLVGVKPTDTNIAQKINTIINSLSSGTVFIPSGIWNIEDTIEIRKDNIHLKLDENCYINSTIPTSRGTVILIASYDGVKRLNNSSVTGGHISSSASGDNDNTIGVGIANNVIIQNVIIEQSNHKGITFQDGVENVQVLNCEVNNCKGGGIIAEDGTKGIRIINNIVRNILDGSTNQWKMPYGIYVDGRKEDSYDTTTKEDINNYCYIQGNKIYNTINNGITIKTVNKGIVENNIIDDSKGHGIYVEIAKDIEIINNTIRDVNSTGIKALTIDGNLTIDNNKISNISRTTNAYDGIDLDNCRCRPSITNNKISGATHRYSLTVSNNAKATSPIVDNNIFTKGMSDNNYAFNGWRPLYGRNILGDNVFEFLNTKLVIFSDTVPSGNSDGSFYFNPGDEVKYINPTGKGATGKIYIGGVWTNNNSIS